MRDPNVTTTLVVKASLLLGMTQQEMADALDSSLRTVQRWTNKESHPSDQQMHKLAALVYPRDAQLAAAIAHAGESSLQALGIVRPPPPPPPPPPPQPPPPPPGPPRPPPEEMIDAIVCAAAEAMGMMPNDVRPSLRAAFSRGRRLGMTMEEAARALQEPKPAEVSAPVEEEPALAKASKARGSKTGRA